jgi:hypothetical protein
MAKKMGFRERFEFRNGREDRKGKRGEDLMDRKMGRGMFGRKSRRYKRGGRR